MRIGVGNPSVNRDTQLLRKSQVREKEPTLVMSTDYVISIIIDTSLTIRES